MKIVKFIRSVKIEEVEKFDLEECHIYHTSNSHQIALKVFINAEVTNRVIPIIELFNYHRESNTTSEVLIAYSEEVEQLLEIPINTIWRELQEKRNANSNYKIKISMIENMNWKQRLKFLFTKKLAI